MVRSLRCRGREIHGCRGRRTNDCPTETVDRRRPRYPDRVGHDYTHAPCGIVTSSCEAAAPQLGWDVPCRDRSCSHPGRTGEPNGDSSLGSDRAVGSGPRPLASTIGLGGCCRRAAFRLLALGHGRDLAVPPGSCPSLHGNFSPTEITLTLIIGAASVAGLAVAYRQGASIPVVARLGIVIVFAMLQFGAMWLSVQPLVARR